MNTATESSPPATEVAPSQPGSGKPAPERNSVAPPASRSWIAAAVTLLAATAWMYWQNLVIMQAKWESDPQYSHGYLVPLFAAGLLYLRRDRFHPETWAPSGWGLLLLGLGLGAKLFASYYYIEALSNGSLILVLMGIATALWGRGGLRWAAPGILFLAFMLPLPHTLETMLHTPLRTIGTKASTYFMQLIGLPAFGQGHVISIGSEQIGVAEACSGLRMLMVFFALSTGVALLISDSWPFRLIVALSAVPIALAANVLRIAATGAMYVYLADTTVFGMPGSEFAHRFFHDWAGWLMIPVALLLLWLEIWILDNLVIRVSDRPLSAGIPTSPLATAMSAVGERTETQR